MAKSPQGVPPVREDGRQARAASNRQRRRWDYRAPSWDHEGAAGLEAVIATVLAVAKVRPGTVAVDLGAGTGSLSLPLAQLGADVTAVDISPAMLERLAKKAERAGLDRVKTVAAQVESFDLPPASVDLVVSNYALHHLRDADKEALVVAVARWLRPGGQLIVGDMMFGRGITARDRAIIGSKVGVLLRRGPGGWWRLAKNIYRFGLRLRERPVTMETWESYFYGAGLTDLCVMPVVSEAAVVAGTKPAEVAPPAQVENSQIMGRPNGRSKRRPASSDRHTGVPGTFRANLKEPT